MLDRLFHRPRFPFIAGVVGAYLGISGVAVADGADSAAAQTLYDEAKALVAEGRHSEACPKLEESQRLDPGSGTLLNLADCYEHVGRTASAWSTFLEAATLARAAGNPEREREARDRAAKLDGRLSKVRIDVSHAAGIPGLQVVRDGKDVGTPQWNIALPIDPGSHVISASAPGYRPWSASIVIVSGANTTVVIVPVLDEASHGAPPASSSPPHDESTGLGTQKTLALVAGGAGVLSLGIGTVFALHSKSKKEEADLHCDGAACRDQTGVELRADAISAGNAATIGIVIGVAGLAGGAALWLTTPSSRESVVARVGVGPGFVTVKGVW
jgi:serine/threonine-protein kinase